MTSTRDSLSIAFLGCGRVVERHAKSLKRFADRVRCYYASRHPERAKLIAERCSGYGSFGTYDEAIANSTVNTVFITLPPTLHFDWTMRALEAGKDVWVEKPAFSSSAQADQIIATCERLGRRVFVAENYCYKPLLRRLRNLLADQVIGEPLFVQLNATKRQHSEGWRAEEKLAGGGALFEGGIHWINFAAELGFAIRGVQGFRPATDKGPLERSMMVAIDYENGPIGTLNYSWSAPSLINGSRLCKISGTQGSITFESNGLFIAVNGTKKRLYGPSLKDIGGFRAMISDFVDSSLSGRTPEMTLAKARRDLALVEQAYATAQKQESIKS